MRWRALGVAAMTAMGCSSASFDVGEAQDASAADAAEDAAAIDASDAVPTDTQPTVDAPGDTVAIGDCPPKPPCSAATCGPLLVKDVEGISAKNAPAFDATGFRCKTLTLCGVDMSCLYYDNTNMLGTIQSQELMFYDGSARTVAGASKLRLGGGAASPCANAAVTFKDGDFVRLTFDGGKQVCVFLPPFSGPELTLYVAADGSTFYDAALTNPAKRRP